MFLNMIDNPLQVPCYFEVLEPSNDATLQSFGCVLKFKFFICHGLVLHGFIIPWSSYFVTGTLIGGAFWGALAALLTFPAIVVALWLCVPLWGAGCVLGAIVGWFCLLSSISS